MTASGVAWLALQGRPGLPKIVDWEERRNLVLAATWRVIARDGLTRASIRTIAAEAGLSSGVIQHYFEDKSDILSSALLLSHNRIGERMARASTGLKGLSAVRAIMLEAMPLDDDRMLEARIEVSFWGHVLGNPSLRGILRTEYDTFWQRLADELSNAISMGEIRANSDIPQIARHLIVIVDGLSADRVLYPVRVEPTQQVELIDAYLESIAHDRLPRE